MSLSPVASHRSSLSEQDTQLFAEKERIERLGCIRQLIFGSLHRVGDSATRGPCGARTF